MSEALKLLIPPEDIRAAVRRLARELRKDYAGKNPVFVCVLKGAFMFFSDLMRAIRADFEVDFVQAASYQGKSRSPEVVIKKDVLSDINGRDVVIVDGIIDSGLTVQKLIGHLNAKGASSIRLCALLLREGGAKGLTVDYVGARIEKGFVVGYGMDYRERYRGLPGIYVIVSGE